LNIQKQRRSLTQNVNQLYCARQLYRLYDCLAQVLANKACKRFYSSHGAGDIHQKAAPQTFHSSTNK